MRASPNVAHACTLRCSSMQLQCDSNFLFQKRHAVPVSFKLLPLFSTHLYKSSASPSVVAFSLAAASSATRQDRILHLSKAQTQPRSSSAWSLSMKSQSPGENYPSITTYEWGSKGKRQIQNSHSLLGNPVSRVQTTRRASS